MDLTTRFKILETEMAFLPVAERMAKLAAPDKRANMLRVLANMDQEIAQHRDEIDEVIWPT